MRSGYPENIERASALIEVAVWEADQMRKLELYQKAVDIINVHISNINSTRRRNEQE